MESKIKLINSKEEVLEYLKINGYRGESLDLLVKKWEEMQNTSEASEAEPQVEVNTVKTSVVDSESIEVKED